MQLWDLLFLLVSISQTTPLLTRVTCLVTPIVVAAVTFLANACPPADQEALMDFKAAFKEPYLGIFNKWTGSNSCQGWNGVSCDPTTQRIADIVLRDESKDPIYEKAGRSGYMTGALSRSLCKLDKLPTLIVADWKDISGEILAYVTLLPNLRILELIRNKINGQISGNIGQLSKLTVLNIADNQISGLIPASIVSLKKLKHLELSNNQLSGIISADIGKLQMMSQALLNKNKFTGSILNSITQLRWLADLDLSMNQITGSLPQEVWQMLVACESDLSSW